jgi:hypothetical protein
MPPTVSKISITKFAGTLLVSAVLLFAISTSAADAPTIAGQWTLHQRIAGNESDQDCTFTLADGKIAGTCKVNDQTTKLTGTADGKKLTWKYDVEYNGSTLTLTYVGTLDDADKVSGTVDVAPYGVTGSFTGQRAKSSK